ncbi:MAG: ATP-binding cassette domain-containing protein [Candidatus Nanopelagicales bacterium]
MPAPGQDVRRPHGRDAGAARRRGGLRLRHGQRGDGPSGSGKSTLLAILALRERQSGGELVVLGEPVSALPVRRLVAVRRKHVAWVAQRPSDSLFPQLTAREQVEQTARLRGRSRDDAHAALERVGLQHRADARLGELSGGEQQRLAVTSAVLAGTRVLVADEPTAELDDESADVVLAELRRCAAEGSCVVVSTHDDRVVRVVDRTLALRHGVLSTESVGSGDALAPIDSAGRLQLPPAALGLFPDGRARVVVEGDGVRLLPPGEGAS